MVTTVSLIVAAEISNLGWLPFKTKVDPANLLPLAKKVLQFVQSLYFEFTSKIYTLLSKAKKFYSF